MTVITVTNRKGGVGKTTIAVHLAAGLAIKGARIGVIDTDSQGHAALMVGLPEQNGLYDALIQKRPLSEVVYAVPGDTYAPPDQMPVGALYLLPSADKTFKIPYEIDPEDAFAFLELSEAFKAEYMLDAVVVDTNPTMSMFDGAVYMAADSFLYVTECERLSFDGIQKAIEQMTRFSRKRERFLGRGCAMLGIVPNKLNARTVLHRTNIAALKQRFGEAVMNPITHRSAWPEATNLGELVYTYAPDSQAASDAWYVTERVGRMVGLWQGNELETKTG